MPDSIKPGPKNLVYARMSTSIGEPKGASDISAVRSTFFTDDKNILQVMVFYPMSNGWSICEFIRLLTVMQTSDENRIATLEG
jgi:alkyl hydroperoxide reductase subunit AhpC